MHSPNELNYMKNPFINSNSHFHYKDITSNNYEFRIKLDPENETKMDLRDQIPIHHLTQTIVKEFPNENELNAFEKADIESDITKQVSNHKYQILLQKEKNLKDICNEKNNAIKKELNETKERIKNELTRIIHDALIFSQKNGPMSSMLPNSINEIISKIKDDKAINISISSIGSVSKTSNSSIKRYESNEFLKMLGIDLTNLNPHNIKIDIDKAWNFIMSWKTDRKIEEVIRYKVVNEIMSVAEKKATEKVAKLNRKIHLYKEQKKKEEELKKKREEELKKLSEESDDKIKKIRQKMRNSVSGKKDFKKLAKDKKKIFGKPQTAQQLREESKKKAQMRKKSKNIEQKPIKQVIKLNSYRHVDKILDFIDSSENLSKNMPIYNHFTNIKYKKKMDEMNRRILNKNRIEPIVESDSKVF